MYLYPPRLCLLYAPPASGATRVSVRPPGPRAPGGRPEDGQAGPQAGPLVPAHRGGVLLSAGPSPESFSVQTRRLSTDRDLIFFFII